VKAGFEVPQGSFATQRFVDGLGAAGVVGDLHEKGRVAAPRHATDDLDVTFGEKAGRIDVVD